MSGGGPIDPLGDVSRETAEQLFGDRLALAKRYAELLVTDGVPRGLLGPREVDRLWDRHLANCAALALAVPPGSTVTDVGSGAGLPGVVLAIARPDLTVRLVEPLLRRVTFLTEVRDLLGLGSQLEVVRSRAEDLPPQWRTDVVTARAVAPLGRLVAWCLPLVGPHGHLLAMKGERADAELAEVAAGLPRLGAVRWEVREVGAGLVNPPLRVVDIWAGPDGGHRPGGAPATGRGSRTATRRAARGE